MYFQSADTCSNYDMVVSQSMPYYHDIQKTLTEEVLSVDTTEGDLLEFGCGTGTLATKILESTINKYQNMIMVDSSKEMLLKASERVSKVKEKGKIDFIEADVESFLWTNSILGKISCAYEVMCFSHIADLSTLNKVLCTVKSKMLSNGKLIVAEKIRGQGFEAQECFKRMIDVRMDILLNKLGFTLDRVNRLREHLMYEDYYHNFSQWESILTDAGFKLIRAYGVPLNVENTTSQKFLSQTTLTELKYEKSSFRETSMAIGILVAVPEQKQHLKEI
jgi:ubiquinone/menaquinone biosynthesis C-methylase UbiE